MFIVRRGKDEIHDCINPNNLRGTIYSFLDMLRASANSFPSSIYEPPPEAAGSAPALNINLGGVNVSLGGPTGSGVYRTNSDVVGLQADGIRDGVKNLFDKVKQGVDRIAIP